MAFRFSTKSPSNSKSPRNDTSGTGTETQVQSKLTSAQLVQLNKVYPPWLKDSTKLRQLPAIYQGVLGQVQLRPGLNIEDLSNKRWLEREQQINYMSRFTDTERVHQLLSASRLSNETLAAIWAHVNKSYPGKLTNRELCLGLALIATYQQLERDGDSNKNSPPRDPFNLVKLGKQPPVPTLYPSHPSNIEASKKLFCTQVSTSKSTPEELNSNALLVDLDDQSEPNRLPKEGSGLAISNPSLSTVSISDTNEQTAGIEALAVGDRQKMRTIQLTSSRNLMDSDSGSFDMEFYRLTQIWLKFLIAMKSVFKRSFDVLNVEHSRQSALEALRVPQGQEFSKLLSLCYPLAHNIKYKINELSKKHLITEFKSSNNDHSGEAIGLFDKNYLQQIDDLMTSINEYWAVLINLFYESGQTQFIEFLMDGLNYNQVTVVSNSIEELARELDGSRRPEVCSICHTAFFLSHPSIADGRETNSGSQASLPESDLELLGNTDPISDDNHFYYHARCANFWLHNVDSSDLPYRKELTSDILNPKTGGFLD